MTILEQLDEKEREAERLMEKGRHQREAGLKLEKNGFNLKKKIIADREEINELCAKAAAKGLVIATPDMLKPEAIAPLAVVQQPVTPPTADIIQMPTQEAPQAPAAIAAPAPKPPTPPAPAPAPVPAPSAPTATEQPNKKITLSPRLDGLAKAPVEQPEPPAAQTTAPAKPKSKPKSSEMVISLRLPPKRVPKRQGKQPGRSVNHRAKTILMQIPWPDQLRAVLFHLLGYMYSQPVTGVNQKFFLNPKAKDILMALPKREGRRPIHFVRTSELAEQIMLPYSCVLSIFAALKRISWSMRLVDSLGARQWKLTPYGEKLLCADSTTVGQVVNHYVRFFPDALLLKKDDRDRALCIGNRHPHSMQAVIDAHRELGLGPIVHHPPAPKPPIPLLAHEKGDPEKPDEGDAAVKKTA